MLDEADDIDSVFNRRHIFGNYIALYKLPDRVDRKNSNLSGNNLCILFIQYFIDIFIMNCMIDSWNKFIDTLILQFGVAESKDLFNIRGDI